MPKLNKLEQLKKQIREHYIQRNYEKAKELEKELDFINYGIKK